MRVLGAALRSVVLAAGLPAAQRKLLYVTYSGGFVHSSVAVSEQVMQEIAQRSGAFDVTVTRDLSLLTADTLRNYDAVFFYTTGELGITDAQKQVFLDFVRGGKGFAGVHSATDTAYTWPAYGEMIGAYFDGHPWTQSVRILIEDAEHPAVSHLAPSFTMDEEIYQFGSFSRERVRVLMALDVRSVNLDASGVHRTDGDFALAWVRAYGAGRVFYSALGHHDETWRDPRFQQHLLNGIRWMMGELPGGAEPRPKPALVVPAVYRGGVVNAASFTPAPGNVVAPGSIISIFGTSLTTGDTRQAIAFPLPTVLAGAALTVNGRAAPLFYASPGQINAQFPAEIAAGEPALVAVTTAGGTSAAEPMPTSGAAIGVFSADSSGRGAAAALHLNGRLITAQEPAQRGETLQVFATGLGATSPPVASGMAA